VRGGEAHRAEVPARHMVTTNLGECRGLDSFKKERKSWGNCRVTTLARCVLRGGSISARCEAASYRTREFVLSCPGSCDTYE